MFSLSLWHPFPLSLFLVNGQPAEIAINNSSNNVLPHAIGHSNKKMFSLSNFKIKSEEEEEHNSTPTAYDIILGSSCKPDKKRTDHDEKVKVLPLCCYALSLPVSMSSLSLFVVNGQPAEIAVKTTSKNVSLHAIGHSNKKKMLSNYNSSPTTDDIILGSSSKPEKKRTDPGEKVQGNNVLPHLIGHSNSKKMLSDSKLKIKSEEVEEHNFTPTADIILG